MPRPRPVSRRPPPNSAAAPSTTKKTVSQPPKPAAKRKLSPDSEESEESEDGEESEDSESSIPQDAADDAEDSEEEEVDVDAPRIAQWVDEEELNNVSEEEESESSEDEEDDRGVGPSNLKALRSDLSSLPLGALRKAQQTLSRAKIVSDSDSEDDGEDDASGQEYDSAPEEETSGFAAGGKESAEKKKRDIEKRKNKHAPMEVTSKRPVPRKKIVSEEKKVVPRDPRFLPITGEFSADRFRSQYGFLSDLHHTELKTLRDNLKRAKKMLASSPRDLRAEREQEVERLERAVKRAESQVNRDRKEKVEASALSKVRQEEKEKQKQGKAAWHMKDADKRELFVRAKFDALAKSGGKGAVKKAIEKKQKKVSQKEKKRRPFAPGATFQQRPPRDADSHRPHKRQKIA